MVQPRPSLTAPPLEAPSPPQSLSCTQFQPAAFPYLSPCCSKGSACICSSAAGSALRAASGSALSLSAAGAAQPVFVLVCCDGRRFLWPVFALASPFPLGSTALQPQLLAEAEAARRCVALGSPGLRTADAPALPGSRTAQRDAGSLVRVRHLPPSAQPSAFLLHTAPGPADLTVLDSHSVYCRIRR